MSDAKASRAERRRQAAQARKPGQPEIVKKGTRHIDGICAGCYFWDTTDPNVGLGQGICRESSPQLASVPGPNGMMLQALWPVTGAEATCGRYRLAE